MKTSFIFLLYLLPFTFCTLQKPNRNVTIIKRPAIRMPRTSGSSGRLSLINYRFNRRPRRKNLDSKELKLVLGNDFDSHFMSIDKPSNLAAKYVVRQDSWKYSEMLQEMQSWNLTQDLQQLAGDDYRVQQEIVPMLEKWLMKKASCPVRYAWEDIGAMFWPRYIRRGECSVGKSSCSWPSGMHCVPSGNTTITILRWQCKTPKGKGRKRAYKSTIHKDYKEEKPVNLKCNWVKVPYPITSECTCTC